MTTWKIVGKPWRDWELVMATKTKDGHTLVRITYLSAIAEWNWPADTFKVERLKVTNQVLDDVKEMSQIIKYYKTTNKQWAELPYLKRAVLVLNSEFLNKDLGEFSTFDGAIKAINDPDIVIVAMASRAALNAAKRSWRKSNKAQSHNKAQSQTQAPVPGKKRFVGPLERKRLKRQQEEAERLAAQQRAFQQEQELRKLKEKEEKETAERRKSEEEAKKQERERREKIGEFIEASETVDSLLAKVTAELTKIKETVDDAAKIKTISSQPDRTRIENADNAIRKLESASRAFDKVFVKPQEKE